MLKGMRLAVHEGKEEKDEGEPRESSMGGGRSSIVLDVVVMIAMGYRLCRQGWYGAKTVINGEEGETKVSRPTLSHIAWARRVG